MAGASTLKVNLKVTGLGDTVEGDNESTLTVPVEHSGNPYVIVSTATTTALQISDLVGHIPLAKMYALYLKAEVGTIYVSLDTAGTGTITNLTADLVFNEGDAHTIPLNPENNAGVVIDAASVTDAFSFILLGAV